MPELKDLFEKNRAWAEKTRAEDPEFFSKLSDGQAPKFFWIGCSDSRVTPDRALDLPPGSVFVHRNVANLMGLQDPNGLAALSFAVDVLKVEHVVVCGHTGCGGVKASLKGTVHGPAGVWLQPLQRLARQNASELGSLGEEEQADRLAELNVMRQVDNLSHTQVVRGAWARGQNLALHGWIFVVRDGLLRDLVLTLTAPPDR
jgi:carbonic anhydrase